MYDRDFGAEKKVRYGGDSGLRRVQFRGLHCIALPSPHVNTKINPSVKEIRIHFGGDRKRFQVK